MNVPQLIFWIASGISLAAILLISYSLLNLRLKSVNHLETPPGFSDNPLLEFIWVMVPVFILIVLLGLTFQAL